LSYCTWPLLCFLIHWIEDKSVVLIYSSVELFSTFISF
jgi:hypothetical protein